MYNFFYKDKRVRQMTKIVYAYGHLESSNLHIFGLWEVAGAPRDGPCKLYTEGCVRVELQTLML